MDNVLFYNAKRNDIKNGDVLLYKGTDIFSYIIRSFFDSPYSHVGIVVWWNARLMVVEAVNKGVIATPLSENLRRYKGGVDFFQVEQELSEEKRLMMLQFAQMQLGKSFNLWALLKSGMRVVLGLSLTDKDGAFRHPAGRYFCSQFVSDIYKKGGVDLDIDLSSTRTSPDAIAKSPLLKFRGVLKRDP